MSQLPQVHVGYERIGSYNHLKSNKCKWNNCFIKNYGKKLLELADFALQEQLEDNIIVAISQLWYNGSHNYTMAGKPIKSLGLHYTTIQFLIMCVACQPCAYFTDQWEPLS